MNIFQTAKHRRHVKTVLKSAKPIKKQRRRLGGGERQGVARPLNPRRASNFHYDPAERAAAPASMQFPISFRWLFLRSRLAAPGVARAVSRRLHGICDFSRVPGLGLWMRNWQGKLGETEYGFRLRVRSMLGRFIG